ncbi:MAG: glycosyl hydrolase [Phycisphaerae bacterium]
MTRAWRTVFGGRIAVAAAELAFAGAACGQAVEAVPVEASATTQPVTGSGGARPEAVRGGSEAGERSTAGGAAAAQGGAARPLRADDFKALSWRSIGPANMSGRVADVAFAPGNAKAFFVGFGTGGLFKTTNAGTSFASLFDKEAMASIGAVAVADAPESWPGWAEEEAKSDSAGAAKKPRAERGKGKIVWVGTGEGNGRNSSSWGAGVYRSTDGGATFKCVGLKDSHDIPVLAVDPRDPDRCYVAALGHLWGPNAERGVYKTTDGGKTWRAVLAVDENTGCCDVLIDPSQPETVYAAMYMRRRTAWSMRSGGPQGGIYRSRDGGQNWEKLSGGLPRQTGRIGLDLFRKNPKVLMAIVESDEGGWGADFFDDRQKAGGLFRSDDGGDHWTRLSPLNFRPFYFSKVRIDPADEQRVYLLGWTLAISDDGGRRFRSNRSALPHGDMHALRIDPGDTDHLLMGTDGGVYASYDRGKTWDYFNQIAAGEFYNIAVDLSDPYRVAGGLQDNGCWVGPSGTILDSGGEDVLAAEGALPVGITNADWQFVNGGDGYHVAFDPTDRSVVYAESQGGGLVRVHLDSGVRKFLRPSPKEGQARYRFNWNSPFLISAHDPTTLYFGGNHVFKLTQRGERWERISEDLSTRDVEKIQTVGSEAETHGTVVSLAESPLAAGMVWAGTDDGLVHVTRDDGKGWTRVTPPQANGLYISRIEASYHARDTAYVAIDGHRSNRFEPILVMTNDGGQSWRSISGDLPGGDVVKVVREDRRNADVLYAGMERGLFATFDRGVHWLRLNGESLPTVAVDDLVQHPREMDLVAGTHGRSIWILDDASFLHELRPEVVAKEVHLFAIRPARPRYYLPYGGLWSERIFRASNPPKGAIIDYWLREWAGEEVKLTITDAADRPVRELSGTNRAGVNRVVWDLQREKGDRFENVDATQLGQTEFVPAGEYTVTLSVGETKASAKVQVLEAPRARAAGGS